MSTFKASFFSDFVASYGMGRFLPFNAIDRKIESREGKGGGGGDTKKKPVITSIFPVNFS